MYIHEKVFLDGSEIDFETLSLPGCSFPWVSYSYFGRSLTSQKIKKNLVVTLIRLGYKYRCTSVLQWEKGARERPLVICIFILKNITGRNDWSVFSLISCVMNISVVLCIQNYTRKCLFNDLQLMKTEAMKMSSLILSSLHHTNVFKSYITTLEEFVSDFSESK